MNFSYPLTFLILLLILYLRQISLPEAVENHGILSWLKILQGKALSPPHILFTYEQVSIPRTSSKFTYVSSTGILSHKRTYLGHFEAEQDREDFQPL